jgi:integrase
MAGNRRGNKEGTIFRRKDGRWVVEISMSDGSRRTRYGKTRRDASLKLIELQKQVSDGLPVSGQRLTFSQFSKSWLALKVSSVRASTIRRYEQLLRVRVEPTLGKVPLTKIGPLDLDRLYASLLDDGLSPQTVVHVHRVLHAALSDAAKKGYVPRNVASLATPPTVPHKEMRTLSKDEVRALLNVATGNHLEALWRLAIGTGMRLGELLGLRWQDVDLDRSELNVRHGLVRGGNGLELSEPKTRRSRRRIHLPKSLTTALRGHRAMQSQQIIRLGPAWTDLGYVFTTEIGTPLNPNSIAKREFRPLLDKAKIGGHVRIHDLRHTAISLALAAGVALTDVAEMAGHSSVAVTLGRYAHALPEAPKRAAEAIERAII